MKELDAMFEHRHKMTFTDRGRVIGEVFTLDYEVLHGQRKEKGNDRIHGTGRTRRARKTESKYNRRSCPYV